MRVALGIALSATLAVVGPEVGFRQTESARAAVPLRTELTERRTEMSQTFRNTDGTLTTVLYSGPVHFRSGDKWLPIDSRLVPALDSGYAWENAANRFRVRFKGTLPGELFRLDVAEHSFAFGLENASLSPAAAAGSSLSYLSVFAGVDLKYEMLADGLKETFTLANAQAPTRYRFTLTPPANVAVRAEPRADGSWAFFAPTIPEPLFVLAPPFAVESDGASAPPPVRAAERHASLDVAKVAGGFVVDLAVDEQWLSDPARRFPVVVDPTITIQPPVEDASYAVNFPNNLPATDARLFVGTDANVWRAALQFDLADVPAGANVTAAQLKLFYDVNCFGSSCWLSGHQIDAHRMSMPWSTSTPWANTNYDTTVLSSFNLPANPEPQWTSPRR
jgi:hypothetical protein